MAYCHFHIRRSQKNIKFGGVGNSGEENSNMALVIEIDAILINY